VGQAEYAREYVTTGLGHHCCKTGAKANRYNTGDDLALSVVFLAYGVSQRMAAFQLSQTGGNEQTNQDVLSRVRKAYTEKEPAAREAPADKAD
jgi:hypothetical protein